MWQINNTRMVAGLEEITTGDFYIDGVRVNEKSPKERDVAMVFQSNHSTHIDCL